MLRLSAMCNVMEFVYGFVFNNAFFVAFIVIVSMAALSAMFPKKGIPRSLFVDIVKYMYASASCRNLLVVSVISAHLNSISPLRVQRPVRISGITHSNQNTSNQTLLLRKMSASTSSSHVIASENQMMNTLLGQDLSLDQLLEDWTNEAELNFFGPDGDVTFGAPMPEDNWATPGLYRPSSQHRPQRQYSSFDNPTQATGGAQNPYEKQVKSFAYPEPSLTAHAWNPTLFSKINIPIDPELLSFDLANGAADPSLDFGDLSTQPVANASATSPKAAPDATISPLFIESSDESEDSGPFASRTRKRKATAPARLAKKRTKPTPPRSTVDLAAPLSILTANSNVPIMDMNAHIMRPISKRHAEAKAKIPRPINSFIIYRRAYTARIQAMAKAGRCQQNVSAISGESWRIETEEVKAEFARLGKLEAKQHKIAFPKYEYKPAAKA